MEYPYSLLTRSSGDKPLTDALELMNNEGMSSLPVLDTQNNVIGNISLVDVRVSQFHRSTCLAILCPHDNLLPLVVTLTLLVPS
jgi:CBS-domain-containing membrane protein